MKRIFFSFNRLFYNFPIIKSLKNNSEAIIFNFSKNLCVIAFDQLLKESVPDLFSKYTNIKDLYSFQEGTILHTAKNGYNKNKTIINLYMQHCFDPNYPEIYLKEYNQLNIGVIEKN